MSASGRPGSAPAEIGRQPRSAARWWLSSFPEFSAASGALDEPLRPLRALGRDDGNAVAAFLAQGLGERQIPLTIGGGAIGQHALLRKGRDLAGEALGRLPGGPVRDDPIGEA